MPTNFIGILDGERAEHPVLAQVRWQYGKISAVSGSGCAALRRAGVTLWVLCRVPGRLCSGCGCAGLAWLFPEADLLVGLLSDSVGAAVNAGARFAGIAAECE